MGNGGRDQRLNDIVIESVHLKEAKGVTSPCEEEKTREDEENIIILEQKEGRKYRELSARPNYLAQDGCHIQVSVKEIRRCICSQTWRREETSALGKIYDHIVPNSCEE